MTTGLVLLAAGIATFALRWVPASWAAGHAVPEGLRQGLTFVGPAAFAALAASSVVASGGATAPVAARVVAAAVALPVARATRSTGATLAVGLPLLWLGTAVVGP